MTQGPLKKPMYQTATLDWAGEEANECWFQVCSLPKLEGQVYCVTHEMLYRANHNGRAAVTAKSLHTLNDWELKFLEQKP